jgi:copper chaperone NosL
MKFKFSCVWVLAASLLLFSGCDPEPEPIQFGSEECSYCRMMITEPQFASQLLNRQGRSYKFDSIECMAAFDQANVPDEGINVHSHWVPDFTTGEEWLRVEDAHFLHSETLRSPMGLYLTAYSSLNTAQEFRDEYRGEILDWPAVKELVDREWLNESGQNE